MYLIDLYNLFNSVLEVHVCRY